MWRYRATISAVTVTALFLLLLASAGCGAAGNDAGAPAARPAPNSGGGNSDASSNAEQGAGGSSQQLPSLADRKIKRTATLTLDVDDISAGIRRIEDIADKAGGFVSNSNVALAATTDQEAHRAESATIKIRVPAQAYPQVLSDLRGIAKQVESENSEAAEVTEEYTDLQSRLRNLNATEQRYLELLEKAGNITEVLTVQDRINSTRGEIEQVQGRINVLNDLTDLATITVQLQVPPAFAQGGGGGWAKEAWDTSWDISEAGIIVFGTVAIAGLVLLPWILVPGVVGLVGWRLFGRRIAAWAERVSKP